MTFGMLLSCILAAIAMLQPTPKLDLDMKCMCLLFLGLALAVSYSAGDDQFVYSGFTGSNLTVDGAATVTPSGLLKLTNGTGLLKGHAFYPTPLRFYKSRNKKVKSFSVTFVFGIISNAPNLSSNGMALQAST